MSRAHVRHVCRGQGTIQEWVLLSKLSHVQVYPNDMTESLPERICPPGEAQQESPCLMDLPLIHKREQ